MGTIKPFPVDIAFDTPSALYLAIPPATTERWHALIMDVRAATAFETGRFAVKMQCLVLYYCGHSAFTRLWKAYNENPNTAEKALRSKPEAFGRLAHKYGPHGNLQPHQMGQVYADALLPLLRRAAANEKSHIVLEQEMAALLIRYPALAEHPPRHHGWGEALSAAMWRALQNHPQRDTLMNGHRPPLTTRRRPRRS